MDRSFAWCMRAVRQISVIMTRFVTVLCVLRSPLCDDDLEVCTLLLAPVASVVDTCRDVTSDDPFTVSVVGCDVVGILLLDFFFECFSFVGVASVELTL